MSNKRIQRKILKTNVDVISLDEASKIIIKWAKNRECKYISISNTNDLVRSWLNLEYREITNQSDLITPDGAPLAFILRLYGFSDQKRVTGPDLMEKILPILASMNLKIFFYGSTNEILDKICRRIKHSIPDAQLYFISPPFRKLKMSEEEKIMDTIKQINPHIIFVGLGCPKQDIWIVKKKKYIKSVFIGIGAAFDYYAIPSKRAPLYMQRNGLEWLYRLYKNPKRLFKRYSSVFFLFPIGIIIQLFDYILGNYYNSFKNIFK